MIAKGLKMFRSLERIAVALESIATDLREMRAEQKYYMELSRKEAEKSPQRVLEMIAQFKELTGGAGQ